MIEDWPDISALRNRASVKPDWWEPAARYCLQTGTSASLLLYIGYKFINIRPDRPAYPFGEGLFRSEQAMERSVDNFRWILEWISAQMTDLYYLSYDKDFELPFSNTEAAGQVAKLSSLFFGRALSLRMRVLERAGSGSDELHDLVMYKMSDGNPFIMVNHARTASLRALSAVNAWKFVSRQPWTATVWEGNMVRGSVFNPDSMAGLRCAEFYDGGCLGWLNPVYPPTPPFKSAGDYPGGLSLGLLPPGFCEKTELLIKTERTMRERGIPWGDKV